MVSACSRSTARSWAGSRSAPLLGGLVADPARWGLDFAFPAVFLALVAVQLPPRRLAGGAGAAAVVAVAVALVLPGNWHIIIAGVAVSAVAALVLRPGARREGPTCGR